MDLASRQAADMHSDGPGSYKINYTDWSQLRPFVALNTKVFFSHNQFCVASWREQLLRGMCVGENDQVECA